MNITSNHKSCAVINKIYIADTMDTMHIKFVLKSRQVFLKYIIDYVHVFAFHKGTMHSQILKKCKKNKLNHVFKI